MSRHNAVLRYRSNAAFRYRRSTTLWHNTAFAQRFGTMLHLHNAALRYSIKTIPEHVGSIFQQITLPIRFDCCNSTTPSPALTYILNGSSGCFPVQTLNEPRRSKHLLTLYIEHDHLSSLSTLGMITTLHTLCIEHDHHSSLYAFSMVTTPPYLH